jgi:hypothetical protein
MTVQENSAAPVESKPPVAAAAPTKPNKPAENESALRKLAAEFFPDKVDETPPAEVQGAKPKAVPKDIKSLAEVLGVGVEALYDLEIPAKREGEKPHKLGELKDHAAEREDFTVRSLAFEEDKRTREADLLRSQEELQTLVASLPPDAIKPEVREAARKRQATYIQQERKRTLEVISDWRDEKVREKDIGELATHLGAYGFPDNYLAGVYDHRLMKYFHDNMKREQQLRAALAKVNVKPASETPGRGSGAGDKKPAQAQSTRKNRHERSVENLLNQFNTR